MPSTSAVDNDNLLPSILDARHNLHQQKTSVERARLRDLLRLVLAQSLTLDQMVELVDLIQERVIVSDLYAWASGLRTALKKAMEPYNDLVDAILDAAVPEEIAYETGREYRLPTQAGFVQALAAINQAHPQAMADRIVAELQQQGAVFIASLRGMRESCLMRAFLDDFAEFDVRCSTLQTVDEACNIMHMCCM
jgi:hypothetical protein